MIIKMVGFFLSGWTFHPYLDDEAEAHFIDTIDFSNKLLNGDSPNLAILIDELIELKAFNFEIDRILLDD